MVVECFPEAPQDWQRSVVHKFAEVSPRYQLDKSKDYPFVSMACVAENFGGIIGFESRLPDSSGYACFKLNDILYGKITPCAENGKVALVTDLPDEYGIGSTEFIVLSPREKHDPKYLFELVCSNPVHGRVVSRMEGSTGRLRVTEDTFTKWLQIAVPEYEEQKAIAHVLRSTDEAIARNRDEIKATQQLKQSLMQQLFTRGIPGRHKNFKQTKIGEIPEDWEIKRLQDVLSGSPFSGVSPASRQDPPGTPILNVSCIKFGICDPTLVTYVDVDELTFNKCRARKGDFYVLRGNGNREYVATGGLLRVEPDPPCIFSDKLIRLLFNPDLIAEGFIPWLWQSIDFIHRLQSKAESGSGLWMMSKRDIRREIFAYPQPEEQTEIVETLDKAQTSIESSENELVALQTLKRSLLQNLLTGKVRVNLEAIAL